MHTPAEDRLERPALAELQCARLRTLLSEVLPHNAFYARKFAEADLTAADVRTPADLARLPFTTKAELTADQETHPPYGTVLTYPHDRYRRMHQTSGTSGKPLRWLDTENSWNWMMGCWQAKIRFMRLLPDDRLFFPFSFGPFLGFWTAFEAAARLGFFCLPGGGLGSSARLRLLLDNEITVVLCTPTYGLRLAEVAREEGIDLARGGVRILIVAGEPGGSIAATRARLESAWGARVFDHYGMTEIGPLGIECAENPAGLHLLETECVAEVIDSAAGRTVPPGQVGELVLTSLGRAGSPLLRYRTGDLVRVDPEPCPCGRGFIRLQGGVLGRADDMIHFRGNNLYPGALEGVIRRFPEVAEYRVEIDPSGALPVLRVELEVADAEAVERVDKALRDELMFRAEVKAVPPGSLPRFEMKARRVHHKDTKSTKKKEG